MSRTKITIEGAKELEKVLSKLAAKEARKLLRKSINAAGNPIVKDARSRVPKDTGTLRKSIGKKVKTYKRDGLMAIIIGPRSWYMRIDNQGNKRIAHKYAHLIEFGTATQSPRPFLRPAFEMNKQQARRALTTKLASEIQKRLVKQYGTR